MWDDLKGILGDIAPTIATAFGGPLAGGAVGLLEGALGLKNATTEEIKRAVTHADPATLLKIKQADQNFALALKKLSVGDTQDARAMQNVTKSNMPAIIALIVIAGFLGMGILLVVCSFMGLKVDNTTATYISSLFSVLSVQFGHTLSFYFGERSK